MGGETQHTYNARRFVAGLEALHCADAHGRQLGKLVLSDWLDQAGPSRTNSAELARVLGAQRIFVRSVTQFDHIAVLASGLMLPGLLVAAFRSTRALSERSPRAPFISGKTSAMVARL
jgi:hypothetical protein